MRGSTSRSPTFGRDGLKTLYKSSWGAKNARGEEFDELVADDFEPRRLRMQAEGVRDGWLVPRGVYGYFRCAADGEALVIFDEDGEASSAACRSRARSGTTGCASPTTSARSTTTSATWSRSRW